MICPACKSDMIVVERNRIELDYCTQCHGVWFDSGELDLLAGTLGMKNDRDLVGDIMSSPDARIPEAARRCPVCRQKMKKAAVGPATSLHIDVCPRRDGLWFDGGELGQLLQEMGGAQADGKDAREQVAAFLAEVFQGRQ